MAGNNIHSQLTTAAEIHVPKGFTEASNHTGLIKNIAGQLEWVDLDSLVDKSNMTAVVDPTVNDDSSHDYVVGSRWVNTVENNIFVCTDATVGAAIWVPVIRVNATSNRAPLPSDDHTEGYKEGSVWIQISSPANIGFVCTSSDTANAQWAAINAPVIVGIDHRTLSHMVAPADDHTQYVHIDGRRAMTGDFDMGNHDMNNVVNIRGEQRLFTQNVVRVKKNPGLGEFSSVSAAVASITTASQANPFLVQVGAGVYDEPQIVMKPWVYVDGMDFESTVIQASDPTNHLVIGSVNSGMSGLVLTGVTSSGKALVFHQASTTDSRLTFWVENVRFGQSDTLVISDGANGNAVVFINSCRFGSSYQFNSGFVARTSSGTYGKITIRNSTSTQMTAPFPQDMFLCDGANCEVNIKSVTARTGTTSGGGTGLRIRNGGSARISSLDVEGWTKGIWAENVGAAPVIIGGVVICNDNGIDLKIDHAGTTGGLAAGANDDSKVFINPAATTFGFIILGLEDGDIVTSGKVKQNQPDGTFTDTSTLQSNAAPMGLLNQGDIDFNASSLSSTIDAGIGYLQKPDGSLRKISWPITNFTAPANETSWLYFDQTSTLQIGGSMPDPIQNIVLGRVVTTGTGFLIVEESGFLATHAGSNIGTALRDGLGSVYSSGSTFSELGTRQLAATPGSYYFGERNFKTQGGSPITFSSFYQDGLGGFTIVPNVTTVDNSNWDNGTGTLSPIGVGNYVKHAVYLVGDSSGDFDSEKYFLVYSQAQYTALTLAEQGSVPNPPNYFTDAVTLVASIIVQQGTAHIVEIRDERPLFASKRNSSVAATSFHHNLLGLNDFDDHLRYLPVDGSRPMTGDLPMGTHNVTGAGTYNGVTVENHHARHQPGSGLDELPTAAAATITPDQTVGVGISTSLARADHIHNIPTAVASGLNTNSTSTQGAASTFSRSDHTHAIASGVVSTQNPDQSNAAGTSANFAKADHIHTIPTFTPVSQTPDQINTQGIASTFSRSDHIHNIPTAVPSGLNANNGNIQGVASSFSRSDHVHAIATTSPVTLIPDQANSAGTSASLARADHVHTVASAAPSTITPDQSNTVGVSNSFARADHIHNVPTAAPVQQTIPVSASDGTAATFSRSDHLHTFAVAAPVTQTPNQSNGAGTSTSFARADHVHAIPTGTPSALTPNAGNSQGSASAFAQQDHIHNIPTAAPANQTIAAVAADGAAANFSRSDHVHTFSTATPTDVGSSNAAGTATSFVHSDHVHKGLHSVQSNGGTQRFGDVNLKSGNGVSVTDNGDNSFTFDSNEGGEFVITSTSGLTINYTGGRYVNGQNGTVVNVPAGAITVGANTTLGYLYIAPNSLNVSSPTITASTTPPGTDALPIAQYVSGASTITSTTDLRSIINVTPIVNSLRVTYPGTGLTINYNTGGVRINGTQTVITAGTVVLTANTASGAIYVDPGTFIVTANTTGTFPSNCVPLALYTTNASAVTALTGQRSFLGNYVVFGSSGDIVTITPDAPAAAGATNRYADSGHTHAIVSAAASSQTPDQANAKGSSTSFARADHVHNIATGTPSTLNATQANTQGATAAFARQDHLHAISTGTVSTQTPDQANATGTSANLARADHVHNIATAAASSLTTASTDTQGVSTSFARADHTHAITVSNQQVTASSAAALTTTALTDTLITGMTITPTAGTYLVLFTSSCVNSANGAQKTFASVYFNGTQVNNSEISIGTAGGAYSPVTVQGVVAANGINAIEIRARVTNNTTTWWAMTMQLIRLSN